MGFIRLTAQLRQDLPCAYLDQHEPESINIITIIFINVIYLLLLLLLLLFFLERLW